MLYSELNNHKSDVNGKSVLLFYVWTLVEVAQLIYKWTLLKLHLGVISGVQSMVQCCLIWIDTQSSACNTLYIFHPRDSKWKHKRWIIVDNGFFGTVLEMMTNLRIDYRGGLLIIVSGLLPKYYFMNSTVFHLLRDFKWQHKRWMLGLLHSYSLFWGIGLKTHLQWFMIHGSKPKTLKQQICRLCFIINRIKMTHSDIRDALMLWCNFL